MRLYRSIDALASIPTDVRRVVTIGAFDGLHVGHREILARAQAIADRHGEHVIVVSFEPTPAEFFAAGPPPPRLTCFRERIELLDDLGIGELFCPHFARLNALEHDEFVEAVLVERLRASHVVVGHDFRYGKGRRGSLPTLERAGSAHDFEVSVVDAVDLNGERVSSTSIRAALQRGDLSAAKTMLGRDYSMSGRVVYGLGLGKDLGFPTANVNLKRRRAPVDGIFAVRVDGLADGPLDGVASVGSRPTVGGGKTLLEVHLFDFDADIYGTYINVRFIARLRAEENFESLDAMKARMQVDAAEAKAALAQRIA